MWPGAKSLEPLGTLFINMMFCVVVPMVFCSISSAIANMVSARRAGKIMGVTIASFLVTAAIAAVIMYAIVRAIPLVTGQYPAETGEVGSVSAANMIVNFFTVEDFSALWSRRAMLPLIVAAVIFGFAVQMCGEKGKAGREAARQPDRMYHEGREADHVLRPNRIFRLFRVSVADYGPQLIGDYTRTLIVYYALSFIYMFAMFPIYARFGGGKGGAKVMFRHLFRPAVTSFGTCSSVATIPTNMEEAQTTGISKDVSDIVIPMGATMHMDGSAMSAIIKVAFLFGIFGMDFSTGRALLAILVAVFSSVAMSGIPGGGGVGELVLCSIFFPNQMAIAYPIAIALGNLVDPPATMINSAGDYVISFIVSRYVDGKEWLQKRLHGEK